MQPKSLNLWHDRYPWELSASEFGKQLRKVVPCESALLGAFAFPKVHMDEVLAVWGWKPGLLNKWIDRGPGTDRTIKAAIKQGTALSAPSRSETDQTPASAHFTLHVNIPECLTGKRSWYLLLTRKQRAFTDYDSELAYLLLRRWQCAFVVPREEAMSRMLLGHDHRLVLTNLTSRLHLLDKPELIETFSAQLDAVLRQRYPALEDDHLYDLALDYNGQTNWTWIRRRSWSKDDDSQQWYIELRPLEPDDGLPPIGVLKDDRIASAIAYLHQHYQDAPSLAQVARYAHMSPFHFHRLFSRQVGISPKQYLLRMQLHVAKWKLRASRAPIHKIAEDTGFSSHGHFTSTFHRIVGSSPSEYRQQAFPNQ